MAKPLRDLVPNILRHASAQRQAAEQLQHHWEQAVGKQLAAQTRVMALRKGALYVQTNDAGAHFTLNIEKPRVLQCLSQALGQPVTDLVIRAGDAA